MVDLVYVEQSLTEEEFRDFENRFNAKIPDSFRDHYMHNNGGLTDEVEMETGKWGLPVNGFLPIKYGTLTIEEIVEYYGNISPNNKKFGSWRKFEFIPFANDPGGNVIFVSLREIDYGSIYIYAEDGDSIAIISSSFELFRSRLYTGTGEYPVSFRCT